MTLSLITIRKESKIAFDGQRRWPFCTIRTKLSDFEDWRWLTLFHRLMKPISNVFA